MTPIVFITRMDGGGLETFCIDLLEAWCAMKVRPTLYVSYLGGVHESDVPDGVERVSFGTRARWSFFRLARWLGCRSSSPCLVLNQELAVVLLLLKKAHIIRNKIYYCESTDVAAHYSKLFKRIMRWLWPSLDGAIEQSRAGIRETSLICRNAPINYLIVRNMVVPIRLDNKLLFRCNAFCRLACIGSFKPMKGQGYLVNQVAKEHSDDWQLTFWGDGEKKLQVEEIVKSMRLDDRILFKGWERDKAIIFESCDLVVVPSDYEGLPNVMLEAILYGRRVSVRPTCTGACEFLRDLGIPETWPWRKALEIHTDVWIAARTRLVEVCDSRKVASDILSFISKNEGLCPRD